MLTIRLDAEVAGEFVDLLDVVFHGVREIAEAHGQDIGVGNPQNEMTNGLSEGNTVGKIGITKPPVVIIGVVHGVINAAALVFPAKSNVQRGNAQVLQERAVIGPRSQRVDGRRPAVHDPFGDLPGLFACVASAAINHNPGPKARQDVGARLRIEHATCDLVYQCFERMAPARVQETAAVAVGVHIQYRLVPEFSAVGFDPLRGSE